MAEGQDSIESIKAGELLTDRIVHVNLSNCVVVVEDEALGSHQDHKDQITSVNKVDTPVPGRAEALEVLLSNFPPSAPRTGIVVKPGK